MSGDSSGIGAGNVDSEGFSMVHKWQGINTGGDSNEQSNAPDPEVVSNIENMSPDQKLCAILGALNCYQIVSNVEEKMNAILMLNGKMGCVKTVMNSYNDRLKLLEYKSIDLEAQWRCNNLLFKG